MKSFDVHDRDLKVHQHHVLQASAGTGKTYSIENLVVRLLLEAPSEQDVPLLLSELLIMTFTRAATRELRSRIRSNIESAIALIEGAPDPHDYMIALLDSTPDQRALARQRLDRALAMFDEAQIFTIHSFCARMLRECSEVHTSAPSSNDDSALSHAIVERTIKDFLRTELTQDFCSPAQLERLLKEFKGNFDDLVDALTREILKGVPIAPTESYKTLLHSFREAMSLVKGPHESILDSFERSCHFYKKYEDKVTCAYQPEISAFVALLAQETWSADDFESLIRTDLLLVRLLAPENRNRRLKGEPAFHQEHSTLYEALCKHLLPVIESARSGRRIFAQVAAACQKHVERYLDQEELAGADQLLKKMEAACSDSLFKERVGARYRFAIVDEFQDTDPIQWTILKQLFLDGSRANLALVGDPKQAIYGFRQADIHTYFEAIHHFGEETHASLDVNYRSTPQLVHAINLLFSEENSPGLLSKPFKQAIPKPNAPQCRLTDGKGAVHFLIASEEGNKAYTTAILPHMVEEIRYLTSAHYTFRDIAILVRDRIQAQQAFDRLTASDIPCILERSGSVTDSPAFDAIGILIQAMLHPSSSSLLLQTLGGPLFALTHIAAKQVLSQPQAMRQIQNLHERLQLEGIVSFFEALLSTVWIDSHGSFLQALLRRKGGLEIYRDLRQLVDLLAEAQQTRHVTADGLVAELRALRLLADEESERVAIRDDSGHNAVRILTIHVSKGLEFPIVFAVGLSKRSQHKRSTRLIPASRRHGSLVVRETADQDVQDAFFRDLDEEKVRLAYVAMTRARDRLYVPVVPSKSKSAIEPGSPSPLELLLARFGQDATTDQGVLERLKSFDAAPLVSFITSLQQPDVMSYESIESDPPTHSYITVSEPVKLILPPSVHVSAPPIRVHSYTSLSALTTDESVDDTIQGAPKDLHALDKSPHTLPAGRYTGILLHALLQTIPLNAITPEAVEQALVGSSFVGWHMPIYDLLHSTVTCPLLASGTPLRLADISPTHQFKEMEFVCTADEAHLMGLQGIDVRFIKGVIDLLFFHQGKYYLVDYKSNWLGPDQSCYSPSHLEKAMNVHHYHLQARIYAYALKRYIAQFDSRPFEELFGGAFYLFLRGMDEGNPGSGCVFFNPGEES